MFDIFIGLPLSLSTTNKENDPLSKTVAANIENMHRIFQILICDSDSIKKHSLHEFNYYITVNVFRLCIILSWFL